MSSATGQRLAMPDADVTFYPAFFPPEASDAYLDELLRTVQWRQEQVKLFGKRIDQPRLTAWYGDAGTSYTYSGITLDPLPWTEALLAIKGAIEPLSGVRFNSVLLNLYRGERDSVSWHSDDDGGMGRAPVIGSVSFGAPRPFQFRHKRDKTLRAEVALTHGSFLLMGGATQQFWQHQISKCKEPCGPRVNLTFRVIQNLVY
jgi:alkylated DNA repair dioxygenase AlkB